MALANAQDVAWWRVNCCLLLGLKCNHFLVWPKLQLLLTEQDQETQSLAQPDRSLYPCCFQLSYKYFLRQLTISLAARTTSPQCFAEPIPRTCSQQPQQHFEYNSWAFPKINCLHWRCINRKGLQFACIYNARWMQLACPRGSTR